MPMETTTEGGEEEGKDEKDRGRGLPVLVVPAQFQAVQHTRAPRYITYESTPGPRRCVPTTTILTTSHHPSCSTSDTPKPRTPILRTHPPRNCLYAHDNPRISTQLLSLMHKLCLMFPEDSRAVSRFFPLAGLFEASGNTPVNQEILYLNLAEVDINLEMGGRRILRHRPVISGNSQCT